MFISSWLGNAYIFLSTLLLLFMIILVYMNNVHSLLKEMVILTALRMGYFYVQTYID